MKNLIAIFFLLNVTIFAYARTDVVLIEDLQPNSDNKISVSDFEKYADDKANNVFDGDCFAVIEGYHKHSHQTFRAGALSFRAGALIVPDSVNLSGSGGYEYAAVSHDGRKFKVWSYVGGSSVERTSHLKIIGQCN